MDTPDRGSAGVFGPGGRLDETLPGYEYRAEQETMAAEVWRALSGGSRLAIEAGTGVGKSLAYLVPAAHWVQQTHRKIAISTYTRILQSQLVTNDVPLLERVLDDPPAIAVAYGQENYLCRLRLNARISRGLFDTREQARAADRLLDWAEKTGDGILLNLPFTLPPRLRRRLGRDSAACRRHRCPYFGSCFYYRARRTWEHAGILILNHALFFAGSGDSGPLPKINAVVFDEAHRLEDACVRHFGTMVSQGWLAQVLDNLSPPAGHGLLHAVTRNETTLHAIEGEVTECRSRLAGFFQATAGFLSHPGTRTRLHEPLTGAPGKILGRLGTALVELVDRNDDDDLASELTGAARWLTEAATAFERFAEPDPDNEVQWIEGNATGNLVITAAPLSVAPALQEQVYPACDSVVLTSATLTVAGRFDFMAGRLGLDGFRTCLLDSPFDHGTNSLIYVPEDLPFPPDPDYVPAATRLLERILVASNGRALVLFTSYDMLQTVRDDLSTTGFTVLCQGEEPLPLLLERFRTDTHSVLLATQSFWQGVDVPGDALSCLVIARLPFDVPDDPRLSAIADSLRRDGIQPFSAYQLPTAALRFRQGFGRLIRSRTDRGVVCVLDRRLLTKGYGRTFLQSLPPDIRLTTRLSQVAGFLGSGRAHEADKQDKSTID